MVLRCAYDSETVDAFQGCGFQQAEGDFPGSVFVRLDVSSVLPGPVVPCGAGFQAEGRCLVIFSALAQVVGYAVHVAGKLDDFPVGGATGGLCSDFQRPKTGGYASVRPCRKRYLVRLGGVGQGRNEKQGVRRTKSVFGKGLQLVGRDGFLAGVESAGQEQGDQQSKRFIRCSSELLHCRFRLFSVCVFCWDGVCWRCFSCSSCSRRSGRSFRLPQH